MFTTPGNNCYLYLGFKFGLKPPGGLQVLSAK